MQRGICVAGALFVDPPAGLGRPSLVLVVSGGVDIKSPDFLPGHLVTIHELKQI